MFPIITTRSSCSYNSASDNGSSAAVDKPADNGSAGQPADDGPWSLTALQSADWATIQGWTAEIQVNSNGSITVPKGMYKDLGAINLVSFSKNLEELQNTGHFSASISYSRENKDMPGEDMLGENFPERCQLILDAFNKAGVTKYPVKILETSDNGSVFTITLSSENEEGDSNK